MADYTMEFKDAIGLMGGNIENLPGGTILNGAQMVGLGDYPIFEPSYRVRLNGLIVDRYMNSEIGFESVSTFRLALRRKMNEIMPLYNRMYEADRMKFDPLKTINLTTLSEGESDSTVNGKTAATSKSEDLGTTTGESSTSGETESTSKSKSRGVASETPQTMLSGSEDYASSASDQTGESSGDGKSKESAESTQNTSADSTSESSGTQESSAKDKTSAQTRVFGYEGNASELIISYRNSLVNTDELVLNDLRDCFMQIFGTDDVSTINNYPWYSRRYNRF